MNKRDAFQIIGSAELQTLQGKRQTCCSPARGKTFTSVKKASTFGILDGLGGRLGWSGPALCDIYRILQDRERNPPFRKFSEQVRRMCSTLLGEGLSQQIIIYLEWKGSETESASRDRLLTFVLSWINVFMLYSVFL